MEPPMAIICRCRLLSCRLSLCTVASLGVDSAAGTGPRCAVGWRVVVCLSFITGDIQHYETPRMRCGTLANLLTVKLVAGVPNERLPTKMGAWLQHTKPQRRIFRGMISKRR